jgi:hypothetical protein
MVMVLSPEELEAKTCFLPDFVGTTEQEQRRERQAWEDECRLLLNNPEATEYPRYDAVAVAISHADRAGRIPLFSDRDLHTWLFDAILAHAYDTCEIQWMLDYLAKG